jgi:mono/diheme cytochrome c family protein
MRRSLLICTFSVAVIASIGALRVAVRADDDRNEQAESQRIKRGYMVAPVPLNLEGKDRALVGLGSYLVNSIGGCSDCHTQPTYLPGGDPFQGQPKKVNVEHYLGGGQVFGPFISRNLTPENGLPAGHTYSEFVQIMRKGTDYDHPGQLLQVMPWPTFQTLTDRDLRAIYEYLRAIPPATPGT